MPGSGADISPMRAGKGALIGHQMSDGPLTDGEMTLPNPKSAAAK